MAKRKYQLHLNNNIYEVELTWRGLYKDLKLLVNGEDTGASIAKKDLKKGTVVPYRDGDFLLKFVNKGFVQEIDILYNGEPLGGSASDPAHKIKTGIAMIGILGGLNILAGILAIAGPFEVLRNAGFGWYNIIIFFLYLCSFLTAKFFNKFAGLFAGFSVFAMDTFFAMMMIMERLPQSAGGTFVARIIFGTPILLGLIAAYKTRKSLVEDGELKYKV